jgi:hypothetical protein
MSKRRIAAWPRKAGRSTMAKAAKDLSRSRHMGNFSMDMKFINDEAAKEGFNNLLKAFGERVPTPDSLMTGKLVASARIFDDVGGRNAALIGHATKDAGPGEQVMVRSLNKVMYYVASAQGVRAGDAVVVTGVGTVGPAPMSKKDDTFVEAISPRIELVQLPDHVLNRQELEEMEDAIATAMGLPLAGLAIDERVVHASTSRAMIEEQYAAIAERLADLRQETENALNPMNVFAQMYMNEWANDDTVLSPPMSDKDYAEKRPDTYSLKEWGMMRHPRTNLAMKRHEIDPVSGIAQILAYFMTRNELFESGDLKEHHQEAHSRHERTEIRTYVDVKEQEVVVEAHMRFSHQEAYQVVGARHPDKKLMDLFEPIFKAAMESGTLIPNFEERVFTTPDKKRSVKIWTPKKKAA